MAISVAFFGLGIGSFTVYVLKNKKKISENNDDSGSFVPSRKFCQLSLLPFHYPIFLFIVAYIIPPNTSFIYLFYIASSIPFFFAGMSLALMYVAMPKEISKLYFVDLVGAAVGTLVLYPMTQHLGAESTLLLLSVIISMSTLITTLLLFRSIRKTSVSGGGQKIELLGMRTKLYVIVAVVVTVLLTVINTSGINSSFVYRTWRKQNITLQIIRLFFPTYWYNLELFF